MTVLEIRDLHVTVETEKGATPILNGVTLTIRTGGESRRSRTRSPDTPSTP